MLAPSALLTDLYQLTMAFGYFRAGIALRDSCFHLHFRKCPFKGGYAIAAGLDGKLTATAAFDGTGETMAAAVRAMTGTGSYTISLESLRAAQPLDQTRFTAQPILAGKVTGGRSIPVMNPATGGQVGTVVEGLHQPRRGEGAVHQQRQTGVVRDRTDRGDVQHLEPRVAQRLAEQQLGFGADRRAPAVDVAGRHESGRDTETFQREVQQVVAAAVQHRAGDDVRTRAGQRGQQAVPAAGTGAGKLREGACATVDVL